MVRKPKRGKIRLPDEKTEPSDNVLDFTYLIFGERKIGKTSLIAQFDNVFFIPTEKGTSLQKVYQPVNDDGRPIYLRKWADVKRWTKLACQSDRYDALCIDTIDQAYRLAYKAVCQRLGITHPNDESWGTAWSQITDEVVNLIDSIVYDYQLGLFMLSHTQYKDIDRFDGSEFEQFTSSLGGKTGDYVTGIVDFWGYYGYKGRQRRIWLEGSQGLDAGTRFEDNFLDSKTDEPLAFIPMGSSPEEGYDNFIAAFNNELTVKKKEVKKRRRKKKRRSRRD